MRRILLPLLLAATGTASAVHAMDFRRVGDTLVMSGPVEEQDLARLRDQLAVGGVKLVLLHQSPGGDLWNGYQLGVRIREEGLPTAVSGRCESACGLIFLSGTQRWFSDGMPIAQTMVGLHGAHATDTLRPMPELGPRMAYVIRTLTNRKYPEDLLQRTVYPVHGEDMVYAFYPGRYPADGAARGIVQCLKQPDAAFKCLPIERLDAVGIGIATEPQLLKLPGDVKQVLRELP